MNIDILNKKDYTVLLSVELENGHFSSVYETEELIEKSRIISDENFIKKIILQDGVADVIAANKEYLKLKDSEFSISELIEQGKKLKTIRKFQQFKVNEQIRIVKDITLLEIISSFLQLLSEKESFDIIMKIIPIFPYISQEKDKLYNVIDYQSNLVLIKDPSDKFELQTIILPSNIFNLNS